jgi:hypothetical protein
MRAHVRETEDFRGFRRVLDETMRGETMRTEAGP